MSAFHQKERYNKYSIQDFLVSFKSYQAIALYFTFHLLLQ